MQPHPNFSTVKPIYSHALSGLPWAFSPPPPRQCYKSLVGLIDRSLSLDLLSKCPLILALPPAHLKELWKAEMENCIEPLIVPPLHPSSSFWHSQHPTCPRQTVLGWQHAAAQESSAGRLRNPAWGQFAFGCWEHCWNVPRYQVHHLRKHQAS